MNKTNIIEKTFLFCWPVAILTGLIIYLITGNVDFVLSFGLGVFSSLLMQSLSYRILKNLYKNNPRKIKSTTILIYLVKYVFFGIILYVANTDPEWNVYFAFAGLFVFRIVSFPVTLITAKKGGDKDA